MVKNLTLLVASVALALLALVSGAKLYAYSLGIQDSGFRYENQLEMWQPDPALGYINRPNFSGYSFGNVRVQTNAGSVTLSQRKSQKLAEHCALLAWEIPLCGDLE